jgi:hypothetical protein
MVSWYAGTTEETAYFIVRKPAKEIGETGLIRTEKHIFALNLHSLETK